MNTELKQIPLKILLAEDDRDDRFFFEKALKEINIGTQLATVNDGDELMDYLFKNIHQLPNIIFLDLSMPRKTGYECLAEMKEDILLKEIPVVMFSTSSEQDKIQVLFKTGADVYIHKPSNFAQLVQVIHHALPMAAENIFSNGALKYILNA